MFKQHAIHRWLMAAAIVVAATYAAGVFAEETSDAQEVTVNVLVQKPAKFVGKQVRTEGVVARVMKDDRIFLMAENSACGGCPSKKKCGVSELAVFYEGKLPGRNKKVKVTGVMTEPQEGKYLFKALRLE